MRVLIERVKPVFVAILQTFRGRTIDCRLTAATGNANNERRRFGFHTA